MKLRIARKVFFARHRKYMTSEGIMSGWNWYNVRTIKRACHVIARLPFERVPAKPKAS